MPNIKEPLFRPDPARPGEFLVSMPGLLLLAAGSAYEADDSEVTPEGRAVGQRTVASILSAARAGGFTQGELLETLLARGEVSHRVKELAVAAVAAAGKDAMLAVVADMRAAP